MTLNLAIANFGLCYLNIYMQLFFDDYALIVVSESFTVKKALGHNNKLIVSQATLSAQTMHVVSAIY